MTVIAMFKAETEALGQPWLCYGHFLPGLSYLSTIYHLHSRTVVSKLWACGPQHNVWSFA